MYPTASHLFSTDHAVITPPAPSPLLPVLLTYTEPDLLVTPDVAFASPQLSASIALSKWSWRLIRALSESPSFFLPPPAPFESQTDFGLSL